MESDHPRRFPALSALWACILVGISGGCVYGYSFGIIGGLNDHLIKYHFFPNASKSDQSFYNGILTAEILVGGFIGSFLGVNIANRIGRRWTIMLTGIITVITSVLLAVFDNYVAFIVIRTVLGVAVGFAGVVCPLYINEAAPAQNRGKLGTVFQIGICASILVAEITNYAFNPNNEDEIPVWKWQLQFGLGAIPGFMMMIVSLFITETLSSATFKPLTTEDGGISHVVANQDEESQAVNHANGSDAPVNGWKELFSRDGLKWLYIGTILSIANQLTGINAIIFYAPKIFTDAGLSNVLILSFSVVGTWNLMTVFISFALVDKLGRRPLMLGALVLMTIATFILGLAYATFPDKKGPIAILSILLFIAGFECGPGPLFFLMAVETFPLRLREQALSYSNAMAWVWNIIVTFGFPVFNDNAGPVATFFTFAGFGVISVLLVFLSLPETKNNSDHSPSTTPNGSRKSSAAAYVKMSDHLDANIPAL